MYFRDKEEYEGVSLCESEYEDEDLCMQVHVLLFRSFDLNFFIYIVFEV